MRLAAMAFLGLVLGVAVVAALVVGAQRRGLLAGSLLGGGARKVAPTRAKKGHFNRLAEIDGDSDGEARAAIACRAEAEAEQGKKSKKKKKKGSATRAAVEPTSPGGGQEI